MLVEEDLGEVAQMNGKCTIDIGGANLEMYVMSKKKIEKPDGDSYYQLVLRRTPV